MEQTIININNNETNTDKNEEILKENPNRFTVFPIRYGEIWQSYKNHMNLFWTAEEIDFSADLEDWKSLSNDEKYFIEHILAFFAGSDGIVLENLIENFSQEVQIPEARCFYGFQAMIENVHSEVYSLLIDTYIKDPKRKDVLFRAIETIPCIARKAKWALKWISSERPFAERLVAFAVVEGVFFSGSFCAIFWLKHRGKMVKALGQSNEFIARDEGLHTAFAILLYKHLDSRLSQERIEEIFRNAVDIECEFICDSLPCRLIGMNSGLMKEYIRYVADRLVVQLGYKKLYNAKNPFSFMEKNDIDSKTNFFEKRVSEYNKAELTSKKEDRNFEIDDDF